MPSFVKDSSPEQKRRKVKDTSSKPEKQQRTLASFFGKAVKKKPPPEPPAPLNDKRKAEVMRIVVGKQRKTKATKLSETIAAKAILEAEESGDEIEKPTAMLAESIEVANSANDTCSDIEAITTMITDETTSPTSNDTTSLQNPKEQEYVGEEGSSSKSETPNTETSSTPKTAETPEVVEISKPDSATEMDPCAGDVNPPETETGTPTQGKAPETQEQKVVQTSDDVVSEDIQTPTTPPQKQPSPKGPELKATPTMEDSSESTPPSKRKRRKSTTPTANAVEAVTLSEEEQQRFAKLKETYGPKGEALLEKFRRPCVEPTLPETEQVDVIIATLIDGSHLPLSRLSEQVRARLEPMKLSVEIEEKIKLLATRKQMIKATTEKPVDLYETESLDWRWEVQIADLVLCKKERSKRKRLANHYHAVQKLLQGVDAQDTTNISNLEEKVLKFERDAEKHRLAAEAKLAKELEKERKQRESAKKKEQESNAKDRKKQELEERKLAKKAAEQRKKDSKAKALAKQESVMKSFLAAPKRAVLQTITPVSRWNPDQFRQEVVSGKPSPPFQQLSERAKQSRIRRSRIVDLKVLQTVEPENPFSQEPQYAEQTTVQLKNKFQLLSFHEDVRPPYWGTWSKRSKIVTGRTPFGIDSACLDYDNDSEGEWEEGDDEMGEDLGDNDMDEDEVEEQEMEGDNDGWLAADDDDGDKNGEDLVLRYIAPSNGSPSFGMANPSVVGFSVDEAMELLEKYTVIRLSDEKICYSVEPPPVVEEEGEPEDVLSDEHMAVLVRFVHNNSLGSRDKLVDEFLREHKSIASSRAQILRVLDSIADKTKDPLRGTLWVVKQEVRESLGLQDLGTDHERKSAELMKEMAIFVHHNTAASKDKLADEVRDRFFPSKSRADAMRLVLSIAEKKRINSITRWVVKSETRLELDLQLPDEPDNIIENLSKGQSSTSKPRSTVTPTPPSSRCQNPKASSSDKDHLGSSNLLKAFVGKTSQ